MPEMIKRSIDKALAPIHVKIQDLEHRVSKLEDIGAREALAALKANMSKMVGAGLTPLGEDAGTTETTTPAQSEKAKDV
ncbi:hypothetical protein HAX54_023031 [Datura stramonium]|uniref:Uncharacterized protein n=1 Tax=Datura stramonium TaxID=4076 RepID=A0ABS8Y634_DATST|nr:hypothetical protein [Datura stramonium]